MSHSDTALAISKPDARQVDLDRQRKTIAETPEAVMWLANFTSPATKATYQNAIAEFCAWAGITSPDQLASDITRAHVIAWRDHLLEQGASKRTVSNRLSALSSLFKQLCDVQVAKINPVEGVRRPKVTSHSVETPALTRRQVRAMLDAPWTDNLKGLRDRAILHTLFYTGCRVSEPCKLRVRDLHEDQGYWVLDFTIKGGKKNRVAIHPELQRALRAYLDEAPHGQDRKAWLFQATKHATGRQMHRGTINQIWNTYAPWARLSDRATVHSARATFITEALENNHPAEAVQKTAGHASITTTLAYDKRQHNPRKSASFAVNYEV